MTHIYMLRPEGLDCRKIGIATDLRERRHTLQSMCPFRLTVERALRVESRSVALAFEAWICANAETANMHGEWYRAGDHLHDLFDCVAPAVDETALFQIVHKASPKSRDGSLERLEFDLLFARAAERLGGNYRAGVYLTGDRNFNLAIREDGIRPEWIERLREVVA